MNSQYLPRTHKAAEKASLERGGVDFVTAEFANLLERDLQKSIEETSSLRKTLVEAIARRDELERQVQFMVDQGKMP